MHAVWTPQDTTPTTIPTPQGPGAVWEPERDTSSNPACCTWRAGLKKLCWSSNLQSMARLTGKGEVAMVEARCRTSTLTSYSSSWRLLPLPDLQACLVNAITDISFQALLSLSWTSLFCVEKLTKAFTGNPIGDTGITTVIWGPSR